VTIDPLILLTDRRPLSTPPKSHRPPPSSNCVQILNPSSELHVLLCCIYTYYSPLLTHPHRNCGVVREDRGELRKQLRTLLTVIHHSCTGTATFDEAYGWLEGLFRPGNRLDDRSSLTLVCTSECEIKWLLLLQLYRHFSQAVTYHTHTSHSANLLAASGPGW
jgi:hypothetical protein